MFSARLSKVSDNEKQPVQVFVRIRPVPENESHLSCLETTTSEDVVLKVNHQKKFTFDKVFTAKSSQSNVYDSVVKPYISDIISGYNCTVITYGTRLTGKTYTMHGGIPNIQDPSNTDIDEECGMIPRAVSDLFMQLAEMEEMSYFVGCTYLELCNKNMRDLLFNDSSQLQMYDDHQNKGTVRIDGLFEINVKNKSEVLKLLNKVYQRDQRVQNEKSSCHTIFTLYVRIYELSVDCEEYIQIGKLCMVDLGSADKTSRWAIDRCVRDHSCATHSLLTLQRVITALWNKNSQVPFRESKLTKILQDSLGGKSKTSIIATISPMVSSSDDTLTTLEYAQRARTIVNKPEVNEKLLLSDCLTNCIEENNRLAKDLDAARKRNGVYIHHDNFEKIEADNKLEKENVNKLMLLVADLKKSMAEEKVQEEELQEYVKKTFFDVLGYVDCLHKLCEKDRQLIELLWSQQLEFHNKSLSVLSNYADKFNTIRRTFENVCDLNTHLDKPKQSLNSLSEVFDKVLDFEQQGGSTFDGCSKIDDCEACEVADQSSLKFEDSINDTPFVDISSLKDLAQANIDGYSQLCELKDSLIHTNQNIIQQIKSAHETITTQLTNVKKETLDLKSNFQSMRTSMNTEMSDVNEEFQNHTSGSLKRLRRANDVIMEIAHPIRNSVGTCLSKNIEDSEQRIATSLEAYIDQKLDIKKIVQNIRNNTQEENVAVQDFSKNVVDFSQSSTLHTSIISQNIDQLQSIIDNANVKCEEVQHAGDTPTRPHRKVPENLKELTPKEKALHAFRERQKLREAADEDASKDHTGAMPEDED
ncbi:hypothetical protein FQR65_LT01623 [Abscondita terminalis]|nr:hypothetical protein FQR65_LT01623 [Abscondita terminalis]